MDNIMEIDDITDVLGKSIYPSLIETVNSDLKWRKIWEHVSPIFFGLEKILIIVSILVSFISQFYNEQLSLAIGIISVMTLTTNLLAHFSDSRYSMCTKRINSILMYLGIHDPIPDLSVTEMNKKQIKKILKNKKIDILIT